MQVRTIRAEEIREGIAKITEAWFKPNGIAFQANSNESFVGDIMAYLPDNGVAIKVKTELPMIAVLPNGVSHAIPKWVGEWLDIDGYVVTQSLIEEEGADDYS